MRCYYRLQQNQQTTANPTGLQQNRQTTTKLTDFHQLQESRLESLILPTINTYLQPAPDQHGFRPDHSTTSALLQLTTDIAMGFNQRKPPD